jgi:2-oxoglutarate dehydrogenase E2 component (dihydrolipoamide succinyltransferase)
MASDIVVPALGESVTEATVAQWLKKVGEPVAEDEPLVELETEKVTLEVNASEAGVLREVVAEAGATVEVGALLGRIGAGDGAAAAPARAGNGKAAEAPPQETPAPPKPEPKPMPEPAAGGETVDIVVPDLGESVTEATVAQWLKQPGEAVEADQPLVELETEKVTLEVNAPGAGAIAEVVGAEGATVEVGALLARFARRARRAAGEAGAGRRKRSTAATAGRSTGCGQARGEARAGGGRVHARSLRGPAQRCRRQDHQGRRPGAPFRCALVARGAEADRGA